MLSARCFSSLNGQPWMKFIVFIIYSIVSILGRKWRRKRFAYLIFTHVRFSVSDFLLPACVSGLRFLVIAIRVSGFLMQRRAVRRASVND